MFGTVVVLRACRITLNCAADEVGWVPAFLKVCSEAVDLELLFVRDGASLGDSFYLVGDEGSPLGFRHRASIMREDILLGALLVVLRSDLTVLNVQSEVKEGQGVAGVGRFHFELEGGMAVVELVENAFAFSRLLVMRRQSST